MFKVAIIALWNEQNRSSTKDGTNQHRIRMVTLMDYTPGMEVKPVPTPENVPYGIKGGLEKLKCRKSMGKDLEIIGKYSGRDAKR